MNRELPGRGIIYTLFIALVVFLTALLSFATSAPPADAGGKSKRDTQWKFALNLLEKGENYRAITELKRFLYFFPQDELAPLARLKILEAYVRGRSWEEGIGEANDLLEEMEDREIRARAWYYKGLCQLHLGRIHQGRISLREALRITRDSRVRERAQYLVAESYAMEGALEEAQRAFKEVEPSGELAPLARRAMEKVGSREAVKYRSPVIAGMLAALLPGAGHLYLGRYKDAGLVFAVNSAFLAATLEAASKENEALTGGLAALEALWYGANIFSAVSSAHKHNRMQQIRLLREIHLKRETLERLPPLESIEDR
jgi:tetratricopeptide (TPR) repeat protein